MRITNPLFISATQSILPITYSIPASLTFNDVIKLNDGQDPEEVLVRDSPLHVAIQYRIHMSIITPDSLARISACVCGYVNWSRNVPRDRYGRCGI